MSDTEKFGFISVDIDPRYRVYLDGENVSARCFEADDKEGFVGMYGVAENGQNIAFPLSKCRVYGEVVIERAG